MHRTMITAAAIAALAMSLPALAQQGAKVEDTIAQRAVACTACHGQEGRATQDGYFPRIAGKPQGYIYNQLVNFREGRRRYPMMSYMVAHLSDDYLNELSAYYANLHPPYPAPTPIKVSPQVLEQGRALVLKGDAARKIPACVACHGQQLTGVQPATPGLLGLPRDYLNAQFGAWKTGARKAAAPDCMAQIAQKLTPDEISAASAWLASQPIAADMRPAAPLATKLPIACGTVQP